MMINANIQVRPAVDSDRARIAAVHAASWRSAYGAILPASYLRYEVEIDLGQHWNSTELKSGDVVLIAESEDTIVGFIAVWCASEPFIDNLHTRPDWRSQGVGSILMNAAAKRLFELGHSTAYLWVLSDNHSAVSFYKHLGGKITETSDKEIFGNSLPHDKIEWMDLSPIIAATSNG